MEISANNRSALQRRMYPVYSRTKKATDFIGRNRRAVREHDRGGRGRVEKGKENGGAEKKGERVRGEGGAETVVVSRSYLDQLLRMSVTAVPQATAEETRSHPGPHHTPPHSSRPHNTITMATHIHPDPSRVPGLPPRSSVPEPSSLLPHAALPSSGTLSPRQQWLADLNQQRKEQAAQRREEEEERRRGQEAREVGYFPWGRPGGGAPIRTNSGKLLTDYASRAQVIEEMRSSAEKGTMWQQETGRQHTWQQETAQGTQHADTTQAVLPRHPTSPPHKPTPRSPPSSTHKPQFARGVGPHVDSFVLEQREQKRRKELTHKGELAAQIAENKRRKEEERRRKELEEKEEEERIHREREAIRRREEEERERKLLKEEEEKAWVALLQARIEEAEESARKAREEAQRQKARQLSHVQRSDPTLHSPPDLTLENGRGQECCLQSRAAALPTRIPLPKKTPTRAIHVGVGEVRRGGGGERGVEEVRRGGVGRSMEREGKNTPGKTRPHPFSTNGQKSHAIPAVRRVRERAYQPHHPPHHPPHNHLFQVSLSPPVPVSNRRFAGAQQLGTTAPSRPLPPPSPPVPALAKKLAAHTQPLPSLLPPATHVRQDSTRPVARSPPPHPHTSYPRIPSPPVPALAKRLQVAHSNSLPLSTPHPSLPSPSVPALAQGLREPVRQSTPLSIHRPPSCQPSHSPPPTLPSIPTSQQPSSTGTRFPQATVPAARQQTILHQLAILREGILSQRSSLDHRVQQILCNKTLAHL